MAKLVYVAELPENEFSLSDCSNYESNAKGDCGGRMMQYPSDRPGYGIVVCETCYRRHNEKKS